MTFVSSQGVGQANVTIREKVTGTNQILSLHLNFDVASIALVDEIANEFAAGQGYSRTFRDPNTGVDGTAKFPLNLEKRRAYVLKTDGGSVTLDMGRSLFENTVKPGDVLELWAL